MLWLSLYGAKHIMLYVLASLGIIHENTGYNFYGLHRYKSIFANRDLHHEAAKLTVWTQLTYHFNGRTVQPLGAASPPGYDAHKSSITWSVDYIFIPLSIYRREAAYYSGLIPN